ncbi:hypothetical protein HanIR_Chr04g0177011 [Helianthus annuus]|nr:hypothetical protein HanIR_Chr04g0177011 [Helianthus annuus]
MASLLKEFVKATSFVTNSIIGCHFTAPTQMASLLKEFVKATSFVTNSILHSRSRVLLQKPLSLI